MTDQNQGPEFICVGPEKTGTTWLYRKLLPHPDIFLPPVKEIRYFYEKHHLPDQGILQRFVSDHWVNSHHRRTWQELASFYIKNFKRLPYIQRNHQWQLRYLFLPHTDNWYLSLFPAQGYLCCGEISPQYANLPETAIADIYRLLPQVKIVITLRNPVDWVWSFARMNLLQGQGRKFEEISEEEFYAYFDTRYEHLPSYLELIQRWQKYFSAHQIYVGFYDQLIEDPLEYFTQICRFLGVDETKIPTAILDGLGKRVNKGKSIAIPDSYGRYIARQYLDSVEALSQQFRPYPARWLIRYQKLLAKQSMGQI